VQYIARYGKTYASKEEVTKRFDNFATSYKIVQKHNQGTERSFEMELNQFADMNRAERLQGIQVGDLSNFNAINNLQQNSSNVKNEVDWRVSGNVSPVLNQGTCGSCWAFSTVSTLEAAFSIRNQANYTQSLSIQYLVDCDTNNMGCIGGLQFRAYKYIR
jgi:KDEL-tailed cysteine endopeptidase